MYIIDTRKRIHHDRIPSRLNGDKPPRRRPVSSSLSSLSPLLFPLSYLSPYKRTREINASRARAAHGALSQEPAVSYQREIERRRGAEKQSTCALLLLHRRRGLQVDCWAAAESTYSVCARLYTYVCTYTCIYTKLRCCLRVLYYIYTLNLSCDYRLFFQRPAMKETLGQPACIIEECIIESEICWRGSNITVFPAAVYCTDSCLHTVILILLDSLWTSNLYNIEGVRKCD